MKSLAHLVELQEALSDWERYQAIPLDELLAQRDKRNMVLHAMLVAIQSSIDIAAHIIADKGFKRPGTYRESFETLRREGIISDELSAELSALAGFRNVLVHIYWDLDMEEVYGILQNDLWALQSFLKVAKHLREI